MISRTLTSLQRLIGKAALVLASVFVCLALVQPALQAAPMQSSTSTLDADKTEVTSPDSISAMDLEAKRAKRRQAQSQASRSADQENTGSVADQLNLEEMVEDNVLLGNEPDSTSVEP